MKLNRRTTIIDIANQEPTFECIDVVEQYLCDDEKRKKEKI